jgi:exonuclease SbcC
LEVSTQRATAATEAFDSWLTGFASRTGLDLDRTYIAEVLARGEAWFAREREALAALTQSVNTTLGECTARIAAREEHLGRRPTEDAEPTVLADLAQRRAHLQKAEDQLAKAKAELLHDDQRRAQSAELLGQLNQQRVQAAPWEQLNELIGSADGAKFRAIAQRHTLDLLLLDANAQLELIAARYRLERLPESLNLIVVDRDMGDERRGVHSLSGGESFLVSLALALGLASLTSSRIRIESLFIDEGFGSLDPETLNTAMGALMHLEAQGRKVGVISHVTEMADAIPVQIRVVRGRNGASRLVVPGQESAPGPTSEVEATALVGEVPQRPPSRKRSN